MWALPSIRRRAFLHVAIFAVAFGVYTARAVQSGGLSAPPEPGDSADYDAIAFNLWKLRGYGYYWSDPEYRAPYEGRAPYRRLLARQSDYYPTAYRPPALPVLLSVIYAVTDRNFAAWRLVNCALVAGAVALSAAVSAHFAGPLAAPLTALALLQSPQLTRFSQMFMTEGIAAFLVALLAWIWVAPRSRPWTIRTALACGVVLGALLASRSIFALWLPLALFVPAIKTASGTSRPWRGRALCLLACVLVISPWWIRNIVVTGAFMPTGTQAPLNLPSGFGPRALMFEGLWRSNPGDGTAELSAQNVNPYSLEYEVRLGQIRSGVALKWIRENPRDALWLAVLHVWQEIRPRGRFPWDWLLPAACVALVYFAFVPERRSIAAGTARRARIIALIVCANLFGVAMTWGAGGRFMLPVQPLLVAVLCAMIVDALARGPGVWSRLRSSEQPA
jgi:hypothetical protein